ncbi:tetratricopeptide repeat protein [Azorhizobium caulinodans]|nr:tetratricopeptide repeat protein [Azorhizobium caulinodans]
MIGNIISHLSPKRVFAVRHLRAADAARDAQNWALAVAGYRAYLDLMPQDWGIRVQLGHALKESGDLRAAEAAYSAAATGNPSDADVLIHLGHLLKRLNRPAEARTFFERSVALLEENANLPGGDRLLQAAKEGLASQALATADAARDAKKWRDAAEHYRTYLDAFPGNQAIWIQLGNVAKEAGDFSTADDAYSKAIALDATNYEPHLQQGHLLKRLGRPDQARRAYVRANELGAGWLAQTELARPGEHPSEGAPTQPPAPADAATAELRNAADAELRSRNWIKAFETYQRYTSANPSDKEAWLNLAKTLTHIGRYRLAEDARMRAERLA